MSDDLEPMIDGKPLTQRELLLAINGKLDVIVAKQAALEKADADHETRLRAIENGHYVSWTAFWSGLAAAATIAGGIAALFGHLTFT